jgi:cytosine/uracil/thiamine/allantoin permease
MPFSVYLACLAFSIWAVVDANSKPTEANPPGSLSENTLMTCIVVFTFVGLGTPDESLHRGAIRRQS